ncbi:MAG: magnesium transporter, partial [Candidatus Izemoplasmatales bacterium]|nr:magnesium transporter [Candidatus Izemoplasmatales bacterium]
DKVVGSIMNTNYVALQKTMTVKQAIKELVKVAPTVEFINNLYVIDNGRLVGVLSLKEIMAHGNSPDVMINDIMSVNLITVEPMTPNEEAIIEMQNYDFMLLPVVDKSGYMMGIVSFDDMADIINEESDEDYSRLAGISDVNLDEKGETIFISVKKRIPWLIILLFINLFTSTIIAGYEHVLVQITTLAIFMPLILNMAGNSGTQSLGVIIRLFATNQLTQRSSIWKHLLRELVTGLFNGVFIGILLFGIVIGLRMIDGSSFLTVLPFALVISLSIFVALAVSTLAGAIIPLIMKLCKIDPAVASGPFITTVNDIISLLLYFGLASAFLLPLL